MRNISIKKILLLSIFAVAMGACEDPENTSIVTNFQLYQAENTTGPIVVEEYNPGTYTFDYTMSQDQITDQHIIVGVGSSSTATEDEDFILETHTVDLLAFQGSEEGFQVSITVLDDGEVEEDETIFLTFTSELPSGLDKTEQLMITIPGCTEAVPDDALFVGSYDVSSTPGFVDVGGGAPLFDGTVTLSYVGPEARSFNAVYLGVLGIGNPAQTWNLNWDTCTGNGFVFSSAFTNLSCGTPLPISLIPVGTFGTANVADDDSFTVIIAETEPEGGCGSDGTFPVTLTFTKL